MAKRVSAKEARVKARSTSLSKKSVEELVNIILRKDNTERSNSGKISSLKTMNDELQQKVETLEEKVRIGIEPYEQTIETLKSKFEAQNEVITERNIFISELQQKTTRLKEIAAFRRKAIYWLFGIYVISMALLIIKCFI